MILDDTGDLPAGVSCRRFREFWHFQVLLVHLGDQGVPEQQTRDIIKVAEQKGVGGAKSSMMS